MKITCQSCGAKYSISDDKVRGRVVKIRCKKCSTAIVVNGPRETGPDPAEQGGDCDPTQAVGHQEEADVAGGGTQPPGACEEWMLSLANGDQRSVPVDEIRRMMQEGTITDDTRAWRDGMTEWLPIAQIQELADAVIPPRPSQAPRSEPPGPEAARRDARLGAGLFGGGAGAAAARVGSLRHRTQDLFGVQQFPPPDTEEATSAPPHPDSSASRHPKPAFTAERGENSVLFTIDTLRAVGGAQKSSAPLAREGDKIDLAQLTSVVPGRLASEPSDRSDFDAILSMGVAGGFGHASLAAPTLPTSAPPPDPEAKPVLASFLTPAKSKNGLLFGIAAAVSVLVVVSIGFLGYALFGGGEEPIASNVDSIATTSLDKASEDNSVKPGEDKADQDKADKDKADQDKADQDKADQDKADQDKADQDKADKDKADKDKADKDKADKDKKAEGSDGEGGKDGAEKVAARDEPKAAAAKAPSTLGAGTKPDPKKAESAAEKKAASAAEKKNEPAPAAAAGGGSAPFSRSAAISALGGAAGAASGCKKPGGPTGRGRVSVTFAPSGRVTTAVVNGPPFAGTSVGGCVASAFRRASVPPFSGGPVTVHKSFSIQ